MKVKFKELLLGIVIGGVIFGAIPVIANNIDTFFAKKVDYPIMVNGETTKLNMPIVSIDDRTYIPLRSLCDVLGISIFWNEDYRRIEITKDISYEKKEGNGFMNVEDMEIIDENNIRCNGEEYVKEALFGVDALTKLNVIEPELLKDENDNDVEYIKFGKNGNIVSVRRYIFNSEIYYKLSDYEEKIKPLLEIE